MYYKIKKALVITAVLIATVMTSAFTFEKPIPIKDRQAINQIIPYWDNAQKVSLSLYLNDNKAECTLYIKETNKTSKIKADIRLYRVNSNGSYTSVASWKSITSYGNTLNVTRSASVTSGYTYLLEADIEVHNGSNIEYISLEKKGYY